MHRALQPCAAGKVRVCALGVAQDRAVLIKLQGYMVSNGTTAVGAPGAVYGLLIGVHGIARVVPARFPKERSVTLGQQ